MTGHALPVCRSVRRAGSWVEAHGRIGLDYEQRMLRRRRLVARDGTAFLADLAETTAVGDGDAFELDDGRRIAVEAAEEPLYAVTGDLPRLAWHIGNRHTPCQIEAGRLLIRADHVLRDMLERLGAEVAELSAPFTPEGGAYGHGRTLGHSHGEPAEHGHDHSHNHSHDDASAAHAQAHARSHAHA
jgi:urease accessory protein